ncbi:MAG: flagellar basal body P-ring formation chaperone FlgA [Oligoflexia bacterium]|nr:flagellar basal body P-ring formation chaperone FlgA [Oligoflexia bacterium]
MVLGCGPAWAGMVPGVAELVKKELSSRYPGARIELVGDIRWTRGERPAQPTEVKIQNVTSKGELQFVVLSRTGGAANAMASEGWVSYSAWLPARIALRRVLPGERLSDDQFVIQDVNVAMGNAFEYRGVILGTEVPVIGLETRQTVLEGQFLTTSAVQRVHDIKRGDAVRIHLISGELSISTLGIAEEPAYLKGRVRVMASKTKREFVGQLVDGGIVEVRL